MNNSTPLFPSIDRFMGEYRWLSNFQTAKIEYDGILYPTTEHAYQAHKSLDLEVRKAISYLSSPGEAKRIGNVITIRSDWELVKLDIMLDVTRLKYETKWLRDKLLETGNAELIEGNTWKDTFWGVCRGKGENHLGKILMKVREEIRSK